MIDTALGCERVLSSLPMVRWAQPVFDSAAQLLEAATSFIAANLSGVLVSDRFVEIVAIKVLQELFLFFSYIL